MARVSVVDVCHNNRDSVGDLNTSSLDKPEIQVFNRRWLMLFLWTLSNIMQGFMNTAMSSSIVILSEYYRVSQTWIEWTCTVWSLTNIIFTIPSAWVLNVYGLKSIIVSCGSACTAGSILLLFSVGRQGFLLAFVGITIASVGSAFTNSVSPRIANAWFSSSEVSTANFVGILSNSVGNGLGFLIPSYLLISNKEVKKGLEVMNWSTMLLNAFILLATILWYQEKPPIAPSKSVLRQEEENRLDDYENLIMDSRALYRNSGFLCLVLSYTINAAVSNTVLTILDVIILSYFPEGQKDVGVLGMVYCIVGVPALVISGRILDKTKKFQEMTLWTMLLNGLSLLAFLLFLQFHSMMGIYFAIVAFGMFSGAVSGVAIEMAVELTYPIPEGTSVGWLATIWSIGSVLSNYCGSYVNSIGAIQCLSLFVILEFVGVGFAWSIPKDYQRQRANEKDDAEGPGDVEKRQINRF